MPPTCSIQEHPDRTEIEALAAQCVGARGIERHLAEKHPGDDEAELRASKTAIHRHAVARECGCWRSETEASPVSLTLEALANITSAERHALIQAQGGVIDLDVEGGGGQSAIPSVSGNGGPPAPGSLLAMLDAGIAQAENEAKTREGDGVTHLAGYGSAIEASAWLQTWKRSTSSAETELSFLWPWVRDTRAPVRWLPLARERVAQIRSDAECLQAEKRERERDPLDVEQEQIEKRLDALALDVDESEGDAREVLCRERDQLEARLDAIARERRTRGRKEREQERRAEVEREEAEQKKRAEGRARYVEKGREIDEHLRLVFMPLLAACASAAATQVHLQGEKHNAAAALTAMGIPTAMTFSRDRAALAEVIHFAFFGRGQLGAEFALPSHRDGRLWDLCMEACQRADNQRDHEVEETKGAEMETRA